MFRAAPVPYVRLSPKQIIFSPLKLTGSLLLHAARREQAKRKKKVLRYKDLFFISK